MTTRKLTNLLIVCLFILSVNSYEAFSQSIPLKFGKVGIKDLKMTEYEKDTSAAAVILADYGKFNAQTFEFTRHVRIKILKKEGTWWGNGMVRTPSKSQIRGLTYNLENGKIVTQKLDNESIKREKIYDGLFITRYFMPNVKQGSVIELKYTFPGMPFEWRFQDAIPVVWNELELEPTQYVHFRKNFFGFEKFFLQEKNRWIVKDVPAIKEEPYMNSITNYITKFEIDLISITVPRFYDYGIYQEFATTWEQVNETLLKYTSFGREVKRGGSFFKAEAEEIAKTNKTDEEKIYAAFDFIKKNFQWNGQERLYPSALLTEIHNKTKTGNSADVNIALIVLLKRLNIPVHPLVLSSRENGLLSPVFPSINKLNYVIAYVKTDDKEYFLDATEKYGSTDLLPLRAVNGQARLVHEKMSKAVDIQSNGNAKKNILVNLTMDEEGSFKGTIEVNKYEYEALNFRNEFFNYSDKEAYVQSVKNKYQDVTIEESEIEINEDDLTSPTKEKYTLEISESADVFGNIVAFNPFFMEKTTDNPFKNDERKYPIDFGHLTNQNYYVNIDLPEDYIVESIPEPIAANMPENAGRFIYNATLNGNKLQVVYKLKINQSIFGPSDYASIRSFYELIIERLNQQITVKKRT